MFLQKKGTYTQKITVHFNPDVASREQKPSKKHFPKHKNYLESGPENW